MFAGLIFAQRLFTPAVWPALAAFAIFCALSGAVYLLNDVADRAKDRLHPEKRLRPIAAGRLAPRHAIAVAALLIVVDLVRLVNVAVPEVVVAIGFVLRAAAGALVIDVAISGWLLICTILLALFLALGKRRHEVLTLEADAARHRPVLAEYSAGLLDQMIAVVTASTVTAYALYTMSPETVAKFHTPLLPATLPFVLYGIFRYLYLLYRRRLGGNPAEIVVRDRALLVNGVLWLTTVLLIIYGTRAP